MQLGPVNLGQIESNGVDLSIQATHSFEHYGQLQARLLHTQILSYELDQVSTLGNAGAPRFRSSLRTVWSYADFGLAWTVDAISSTRSTQGDLIAGCRGVAICIESVNEGLPQRLSAWITHELQAHWDAPWQARVTVGVTNPTDRDPPLDLRCNGLRGYNFDLYDSYGRVPYIRYTQSL